MKPVELIAVGHAPPSVPVLGTRRSRRTVAPMSVRYRYGQWWRQITVPAGFVHNGPSIPPWLEWLEPRTNAMYRAAVLHDYLYVQRAVPRLEADAAYLAILAHDGVDSLSRLLHLLAIRVAGYFYW